jgi:hypothetical protein
VVKHIDGLWALHQKASYANVVRTVLSDGRTADNCRYAGMLYHIIDLARVEDSSQATLGRKRFHHDVMHDQGIKVTYRQTNTRLVTAGLRRRQSGQASLDSGMECRQCNSWFKCLEDSISHGYPTENVHQRTLIQSIGLISIYVFDLDTVARN